MIDCESSSVVVRVWLLGEFKVERRIIHDKWEEIKRNEWDKDGYAKRVMKWLLCAPRRRAQRGKIIEELWPETTAKAVEGNLNKAVNVLRKVLRTEGLLKTFGPHSYSGYEFADQSILWTDSDACEALMTGAENVGRTSVRSISLLEEAIKYFDRGSLLEGDSGWWCHALRASSEQAMKQCRLWLAEAYEQQRKHWQARTQYSTLMKNDRLDEDVLCRFMSFLHRNGMTRDALEHYKQSQEYFKECGLSLSDTTIQLAEQITYESLSPDNYLSRIIPSQKPVHPSLPSTTQVIIEKASQVSSVVPIRSSLSGFDMLMKSRRQVLQDILNVACAAITLSPYELLPKENRARLELAKTRSSYLDDEALNDLGMITARYWSISKNASVDALSGISGHFSNIVQFLNDPHPDTVYKRLCSLASENALILGKTFHDIKEYDLAWAYYKFSLRVALDTGNTDLWAAGIGRVALLLIYWGEPHNALPLLQEARRTPLHNQRIGPWLSAIEAEIYAGMGNEDECLRLLETPKSVTLPTSLGDDFYATGFNPSRAAGYEGACFVRLQKPELALPALERAFTLCEPTSLRRQSTLIADIGTVHAQLGDPKEASRLLCQALDMTMQTKSLVVLQRVCKARNELMPWKNSAEVRGLDEQITNTFTVLTKLKEKAQA